MRVFVIAGEASGDALGAALLEGLVTLSPGIKFEGVGGPLMAAAGLHSRFPMEELSVMGLAEVLPKYPALRRRMIETADAVIAARPDALITIDSPDFCLRVAARVRAARPDIPVIHYVAPSVWAWRPGRAAKMARHVDHVLALLPFEPPYMHAAGMRCDFVGHPVTTAPQATGAEVQAFRAAHGIASDAKVLMVLPGSRRGEVARLGPVFGEVLRRIAPDHPGLRLVLPTVRGVADAVRALAADWPGDPVIVGPGDGAAKRAAFGAADAALAASGTVSLELAAAGVPMVIAYRMNWLTQALVAQLLRVQTVTLVNLVSETRAVPEFLGPACTPDRIAPALSALLQGGAAQEAQTQAMAQTMASLGAGGTPPGLRAAQSVLRHLGREPVLNAPQETP
jgi:lipid-A-disaccharide synthase